MGNVASQSVRIPEPKLTDKNLPDQHGRVHVVTGGYAGVGFELSKILYSRNATVFVAGRSEEKATKAIESIKKEVTSSTGELEFLKLDLADLTTIKASAQDLLSRTDRIDVLTNNAGVMQPPVGSKTAQGYELQLGTNVLGPYLFTQQVLPLIKKTASTSPPGQVRISWAASVVTEMARAGGLTLEENGAYTPTASDQGKNYAMSKIANIFLAAEAAKRYGSDGIVSVAFNPGNLKTELSRHMAGLGAIIVGLITFPAVYGGYTELAAACSPDVTLENNGAYVVPWGQLAKPKQAILDGISQGNATKLWDWCEEETKKYA